MAHSHHSIQYGNRRIALKWPPSVDVTVVGRRPSVAADEDAALLYTMGSPLGAGMNSFETFIMDARRPLVVVNDATRSTPTARILPKLLPALTRNPNWGVIVATGLHRAPSEGELQVIFGESLPHIRDRILIHDGRDSLANQTRESLVGPVSVNREVLASDLLIPITSVEPHFFAGFTGGRKSIIPGLAGKETVEKSHAGAVSEEARALRIDGNPVREFIDLGTQVINSERVFSIQVVLDAADQIIAAYAGHIDLCFPRACEAALKYYEAPVDQLFDIVVAAVHPPLDLNLYQMQKGWELCRSAVREGGVMIVTSPCNEGVGSPFYQRLSEQFPNQADWLGLADRPYTMGLHKLVRTARMTQRCRLMAVTNMSPYDVQRFGYEPHGHVNAAITAAIDYVGTPARALIVNDAALTTVTIRNDKHS